VRWGWAETGFGLEDGRVETIEVSDGVVGGDNDTAYCSHDGTTSVEAVVLTTFNVSTIDTNFE